MCPMKSQISGVIINELPKYLSEDPDEKTHAIIANDMLNLNEPLIILLALKGVTSYLLSRKPKESEYEDESVPQIDMKREEPVWEPS